MHLCKMSHHSQWLCVNKPHNSRNHHVGTPFKPISKHNLQPRLTLNSNFLVLNDPKYRAGWPVRVEINVFVSQAFFLRLEIREHLTWSFTWNETYQASENNRPFHGHSALRGTEGEDIRIFPGVKLLRRYKAQHLRFQRGSKCLGKFSEGCCT